MKPHIKHQTYPNILFVLAALLVLALAQSAGAQFVYTTNNGAITITGYTGSDTNLIIPGTINGYPVTTIGTFAFSASSLRNLTIPKSVTNITGGAFEYSSSLTNITVNAANPGYTSAAGLLFNKDLTTLVAYPAGVGGNYAIPGSVSSIGNFAFGHCLHLVSVTMEGSVSNVGSYAFSYCSGLMNVTMGNSVGSIGDYAFTSCSSLTDVIIPDSVTNLGNFAFWGCDGLRSVTIGNKVGSIGEDAFTGCSSLTGVTMPGSVTNLGSYAFLYCSSLTNLTIGSNVSDIGENAFAFCSNLTTVMIPDSVTSIGAWGFEYCTSLAKLTIGNNVSSIGHNAFQGCSLTSVTIPGSVTNLGSGLFGYCVGLTNIDVNKANLSYASAGGVVFNKNLTTLILCPQGLTGSYVIPNSVTSVAEWAFAGCSGLTSVTIPNSVASIGYGAFWGCWGLSSVTIPNSVSSIGTYAFRNCAVLHQAYFQGNAPSVNGVAGSADITVFLSDSGTAYFLPGTTGWGDTFGGWPTAEWYQPHPQILEPGFGLSAQNNGFEFTISWATNSAVVVEASTNLQNWTPLITNTLVNGTSAFFDSDRTHYPQRFYRVRSQ